MRIHFQFGQVVQEEMSFKDISIFRSDGHFVQRSGTIRGILVNGIMGNILMKYYVVCGNSIKYSASSHLISFPQLV